MASVIRVSEWWEVRETPQDDPLNFTESVRLYTFDTKKKALVTLCDLRKEFKGRWFKLCRSREKTTIDFRKD